MIPFLLIFFGTYAAMNGYLLWRIWSAFHPGLWLIPIAAFLLLMVVSPLLCPYLTRRSYDSVAQVLAWLGYPWMAMIFWFVVLMAAADVYNLAVHGVALAAPGAKAAMLPLPHTVAVIGIIIIVLLAVGLYQAQRVVRHDLSLTATNLPQGKTLTIAQISDVHLGMHTGHNRLQQVVEIIRDAKPDMILATGDMIDGSILEVQEFADELAQLQAPLGKFAVMGNHEFYSGVGNSVSFHQRAGFELLRQQSRPVGDVLLVGVDDPTIRRLGKRLDDELPVLPEAGSRPLTILLKHRPNIEAAAVGRFDLQLSGHTHGGQIFPWHAITLTAFPRYRGLYDLGSGSWLYVNKGAGTWGPPIRLGATPEVTIITLRAK